MDPRAGRDEAAREPRASATKAGGATRTGQAISAG